MKEEGETDTVRPESFWIVARRFESAVVAGREVAANCGHTQSLQRAKTKADDNARGCDEISAERGSNLDLCFQNHFEKACHQAGSGLWIQKVPEKWSAPTNFCACSDETVAGWVSAFGFSQVKALVGGSSGREKERIGLDDVQKLFLLYVMM